MLLLLAILLVLGLMIWPTRPTGQVGSAAEALQLRDKLVMLDRAIRDQKTAQADISESEVNAYLKKLLEQTAGAGRSSGNVSVQSVTLSLDPMAWDLHCLTSWMGLPISFNVSGQPEWTKAGFHLNPDRLRFGHMPWPRSVRGWITRRLVVLFDNLDRERFVLDRVVIHSSINQHVRVETAHPRDVTGLEYEGNDHER